MRMPAVASRRRRWETHQAAEPGAAPKAAGYSTGWLSSRVPPGPSAGVTGTTGEQRMAMGWVRPLVGVQIGGRDRVSVSDSPEHAGGLPGGGSLGRVRAQHGQQHRGEGTGVLRRRDLTGRDTENDDAVVGILAEGWRAFDCGVERGAEGEDIGAACGLLTARDLGRQVRGGAGHNAGSGDRDVADGVRDTEIGDLDGVVVAEEQVARLEVAVHDSARVRRGQRRGGLGADPRDRLGWEGPLLGQYGGQAAGGHILHHQHQLTVVINHVVHGDRVGVAEPGRDPPLPHHALPQLLALGLVRPQLLNRHWALQPLVHRQPHHTHRAGTQAALQPIPAREQSTARIHDRVIRPCTPHPPRLFGHPGLNAVPRRTARAGPAGRPAPAALGPARARSRPRWRLPPPARWRRSHLVRPQAPLLRFLIRNGLHPPGTGLIERTGTASRGGTGGVGRGLVEGGQFGVAEAGSRGFDGGFGRSAVGFDGQGGGGLLRARAVTDGRVSVMPGGLLVRVLSGPGGWGRGIGFAGGLGRRVVTAALPAPRCKRSRAAGPVGSVRPVGSARVGPRRRVPAGEALDHRTPVRCPRRRSQPLPDARGGRHWLPVTPHRRPRTRAFHPPRPMGHPRLTVSVWTSRSQDIWPCPGQRARRTRR